MPHDSESTDDLMDLLFTTTIKKAKTTTGDHVLEETDEKTGDKKPKTTGSGGRNTGAPPVDPGKPKNKKDMGNGDPDPDKSGELGRHKDEDVISGYRTEDLWSDVPQGPEFQSRADDVRDLTNNVNVNIDTTSTDEQTKAEQEDRRKKDADGQHQRSVDDVAGIEAPEYTTDELDEMDRKRKWDNGIARAEIVGKSILTGLIMSDPADKLGYRADRAVATAFDGFSRFVGAMLNGDPMSVASAAWYGTIANLQIFGRGIESISARVKRDFNIQDEIDQKKKDMILKERLAIENYKLRHGNIVKIHAGTMNDVYNEMAGYTACMKLFGDENYARNALGRTSKQPKWLYGILGNESFRKAASQGEGAFRAYIRKTHHEDLINNIVDAIPDSDRLAGDGISRFHQIFKARCSNLDGDGSLLMMMPESALPSIRNDLVDKYVDAIVRKHTLDSDENASVESRQLAGDEVLYYQQVLSSLDKYGGNGGGPTYLEAVKQGNAHVANITTAIAQNEVEFERVYKAESPAFQAIVAKANVDPAKQRIKTVRYGGTLISTVDPGKTIGGKTVRNYVNTELNDLMGQYVGDPAGLDSNQKFVSLFNLQSTFDARARLDTKMAFLKKEGLADNQELLEEISQEYVQALKDHPWRTFGVQTTLTRGSGVDLTTIEDWENKVKEKYKPQEEEEKAPETPEEMLTGLLTGIFGKDMDRVKVYNTSGSRVIDFSAKDGYNSLPLKMNFDSEAADGVSAMYADLYTKYKLNPANMTPEERKNLQILNLLCSGHRRMRALDSIVKAAKDSKLYFGNSETLNSVLRNSLLYNYADDWRDWKEAISADYSQPDSVRLIEESKADMTAYGLDASDKKSVAKFLVDDVFHRRPEAFSKYLDKASAIIGRKMPDIPDIEGNLTQIWNGEYFKGLDDEEAIRWALDSPDVFFEDVRDIVHMLNELEAQSKTAKDGGVSAEISNILSCQYSDSAVDALALVRSKYLASGGEEDRYKQYLEDKLGLSGDLVDNFDEALRKNTGLIGDIDPAVYTAGKAILDKAIKAIDNPPKKKKEDKKEEPPPEVDKKKVDEVLEKLKSPEGEENPPEGDSDLEEPKAEVPEEPQVDEELEERKLGYERRTPWNDDKRTRAYRHREYFQDALDKGDIRSVHSNGLPKALFEDLMNSDLMDMKAKPVIFAGLPAFMTLDRNSNVSYSALGKISTFFATRAGDIVGKTARDVTLRKQYENAAKTYDMLSRMVRAERYSRVKTADLGISLEDLCDNLIRKGPFDTVNELQEFMDKYGGSVTANLVADSAVVRGAKKTADEGKIPNSKVIELMEEQNRYLRDMIDKIGSGGNYGGGSFGGGRALPLSDEEKEREEELPLDLDGLNDPNSPISKEIRAFNGRVIPQPTYGANQKDRTGLLNKNHVAYPLYPNTGGASSEKKRSKVPEKIISLVLSGTENDKRILQEYMYAIDSPFLKDGTVSGGFNIDAKRQNENFEAMVALTDYSIDLWNEIVSSVPYRIAKENNLIDGHGHFVDGDAWDNNPFRLSLLDELSDVKIDGVSLPDQRYIQNGKKSTDEVLKTNGDVLLNTVSDLLKHSEKSLLSNPEYTALITELKESVDEFSNTDGMDDAAWRVARGRLWDAVSACCSNLHLNAVQILDPKGGLNTFGDILSRELNTEKKILGVGSDGLPSGRVSRAGNITMNLSGDDQDKFNKVMDTYNASAANKLALYTAIKSMRTLDNKIQQIAHHFMRYDERYVRDNDGNHPKYLYEKPTYTQLKYMGSPDDPGTLEKVSDLINGTWQIGSNAVPRVHQKKVGRKSRATYDNKSIFRDRTSIQDLTTSTGSAARVAELISSYSESTDQDEKDSLINDIVTSLDKSCPELAKVLRDRDHGGKLIEYIRANLGVDTVSNIGIDDFVQKYAIPRYIPSSGTIVDNMTLLFPQYPDGKYKGDEWVKNFLSSGMGVMGTSIPVLAAFRLAVNMRNSKGAADEGFWNVVNTILGKNIPGVDANLDIFSEKSADKANIEKYLSEIGSEFVSFMNNPTSVKDTTSKRFTDGQVSSARSALNVNAMFSDQTGHTIGVLGNASPDIMGMFWDFVYSSNDGGLATDDEGKSALPNGSKFISDPKLVGYTLWLAYKMHNEEVNAALPMPSDFNKINPNAEEYRKRLSKITKGDTEKGKESLGARLLAQSFGQYLKSPANPYLMYVAANKEYVRLFKEKLTGFKPTNEGTNATTLDEFRIAVAEARDYALSQLSNASVDPTLADLTKLMEKQIQSTYNPIADDKVRNALRTQVGSSKGSNNETIVLGPVDNAYGLKNPRKTDKGTANGVFSYEPGVYDATAKHIPGYIYDKIESNARMSNGDEVLIAAMLSTIGPLTYDAGELSPPGTSSDTLWDSKGVRLNVGGGKGCMLNRIDTPIVAPNESVTVENLMDDSLINGKKNVILGKFKPVDENRKAVRVAQKFLRTIPQYRMSVCQYGSDKYVVIYPMHDIKGSRSTNTDNNTFFAKISGKTIGDFKAITRFEGGLVINRASGEIEMRNLEDIRELQDKYNYKRDVKNDEHTFNTKDAAKVIYYGGKKDIRTSERV